MHAERTLNRSECGDVVWVYLILICCDLLSINLNHKLEIKENYTKSNLGKRKSRQELLNKYVIMFILILSMQFT